MHKTAATFGAAFFRFYADAIEGARILEVGAYDVVGTLRGCAPLGCRYTGIDLESGPGVDLVLDDPYSYPFDADSFDVIASSSCFEHDLMFWLSFAEMCRVLRPGGFIYLSAPSNGPFHRYPTDNWRFYPDAGLALAAWGRRQGHDVRLIESMIGRRRDDVWNDCVMVFAKGEAPRPPRRLAEVFPRSYNIRIGEEDALANYSEATEDMAIQAALAEKLPDLSDPDGGGQTSLAVLIAALAEREVHLGARERAADERSAAAQMQIDALQGALAERTAQLAEAERAAQLAEAERTAQDRIDRLQGRCGDLEKIRADLEARLAEADRNAAEREGRIMRLSAELATLGSDLAARERKLTDTLRLVEKIGAELRTARAELAAGDAALDEAGETIDEIAEERDRLAEAAEELARARDRFADESGRWFDAAILAAVEEVMRPDRRRRPVWWLPGRRAAPSMIARADRAREERRWERAARFYLEALRRHPDTPAIWVQLGHALKEAGRIAEAELAYRRAVELAPDNFDAVFALGALLQRLNRTEEAVAAYIRARDLTGAGEGRAEIARELAALDRRPG